MTPYQEEMLPLKNCLVGARILLFIVEQVFLLMGKLWSMHNADTQCIVRGERKPKGRENFLGLTFS